MIQQIKLHNINFKMLLRVLGLLLIIESVFMLGPLVACLYYGESDWLCFALTCGSTLLTGLILTQVVRPSHSQMGKREGFLLTSTVWVVFSVFGMMPFMFCTTPISFTDAFFEAMSGFTTTGASVLDSISHMSHGILLWRALMQWIGGMGIILFTLAVIPMLNHSGGMQMFNAEVTGITHDKLRPRISQTAKSLWLIYISLTVLLIMLLWIGPMTGFESICHAFGAISTGGFSTSEDSIEAWHSVYVKVVITVFMFLGGVNFGLMYKAVMGHWKQVRHNDVIRVYLWTVAVMLVLFVLSIIAAGAVRSSDDLWINPLFAIVSTITSTGYSVANFENWGPFVLSLTFLMMFCGASAGSTSGGAKIDRVLFLIKNCRNEIYRCIYPNNIRPVKINGKVVNPDLVNKVIAFLCIYMILVCAGGTALTAMGLPPVDSFFSAFSCLSNTGLGAGVTGYGGSYSLVPEAGKWLLSLLMLIGRLEIFTVLVLFVPGFWRR